jgi:thermitase
MKQAGAIIAVVFSLILVTTGISFGAQPVRGAEYKPDEIIIKYRQGKDGASDALHQQHGSQGIRKFKAYGLEQVKIRPGQSVQDAIRVFESDPDVAYAEPNYIVHTMVIPADTYESQLWGMDKISAPAAWDISTGSQTVIIGTIDTGVDYTHPDLSPNIWTSADGSSHGYNAITHVNDPMDDNGHGTHVAGTIGAVGNNGIGVVGVNWNVKIMACKFLDAKGSGYIADAIECMNYFGAQKAAGVNIIATNNSWGGGGYSQALYDAINAKPDILFIAAAGNSGTNNDVTASYPANYDLPNVVAVAATDSADALASWSQYGRRTVDIGAPGVNIYSTLPHNSYANYSGTSMATPHVTGLAGLIKAKYTDANWQTIKNRILSTGDNVSSLTAKTLTGKRINANNALTCTSTNSSVLAAIQYPKTITVGKPATLSALSINCGSSSGPVYVELLGGERITLVDDGTAPDQAAGDGVFTGTYFPPRSIETFVFSSPIGTETIGNPLAPLAVSTASLASGTVWVAYKQTLAATGGVAPYTWSTSGPLPAGLSLSSTGVISGTPTTAGNASFSVTVTDYKGATAARSLTITIAAPAPTLTITTTSLPVATRNGAYSTTLAATGGTAPYSWSISSNSLPRGLSLGSSTGVISGTPTRTGTSTFTVSVRDNKGTTVRKSLSISVK